MKNLKKIIIWLIFSSLIYSTYANVDQTNPFTFSYNCTASWWILNADFNLWWHHHYLRSYKIDKPWTIEISDPKHTTISKTTWISIDWCNYEPTSCDVSIWWNWAIVSSDTITKEISINTTLSVIKSWNTITIDWEWEDNDIIVSWFQNYYNWKWKKVIIEFLANEIILKEKRNNWINPLEVIEKIEYTNNTYNSQKEYYYDFTSNNKIIKLKRNVFKRSWTWSIKTSENPYDVFSAYTWQNTWDWSGLLPDRLWTDWYKTGLDLWDYNQHNYTTTKINLYPVTLNCNSTEFSNWTPSDLSFWSFTWTLWWIVEPKFSWDNLKINWFTPDSFWWFSIPATWWLDISGLEYVQVWKIDWNTLWVDQIKISIKENDFTKSVITKSITPAKITKWYFDEFKWVDLNWNTKVSWNYQIVFSFFKWTQQLWSVELPLFIYPNNLSQTNSSINLISATNSKYANNSDFYEYKITLKDDFWNRIKWLNINYLNQDCSGQSNCKTITTNMINNLWTTWSDALIEETTTTVTDNQWKLSFKLKSLAPWVFSEIFKITINNWYGTWDSKSISLNNLNQTNSFKKLFVANLKLSSENIWITEIIFWTSLKYILDVTPVISWIPNYLIDNFKSSIKASDELNYLATEISEIENLSSDPKFSATINTSITATSILEDIWITISPNPIIKYTIWWKEVSYRLSSTETDYTNSIPLVIENPNEFIWVQIIWSLQWQWKQEVTWQKANFSDLSKQDLRTSIRKNAYNYIKSMKTNTVLNWVKYVNWDVTISGNQDYETLDYETLVVTNWNVIIDWNLNPSNKKLWIIVIKDWYDTNTWYNLKWNVYVKPGVSKLNAIIYADWWLISVNNSWVPYTTDDSTRISDLKNQLVMNWTLFTRNTIWWAIYAWWNYKLPWDKITTSFDKAVIYDLNYTRRWKNNCEKVSSTDTTCKYTWAFVIIYNSTAQSNPPKLFSNN